jgi:hypothetical protein
MNKRRYLFLRGWSYILIAVAIILTCIFKKIDEFGFIFSIIFIPLLAYQSYSCFKKLQKTDKDDMAFVPREDSPATEKISYFKRLAIVGGIAFAILSVWTYFDLQNLESGTVEYVKLWAPISLLYNLGGFWLATLITPILGIVIILLLLKKNTNTKR